MNKDFKFPPKSTTTLTSPVLLTTYLSKLVGNPFKLTGKTRTDGSNIRKLIAATLDEYPLSDLAELGHFEIVPPKGKGIPKITREFIDTYIVTSGNSYNLQVWNRVPDSETLLIKYDSGESLKCSDVRFIFVRIDVEKNTIASIIILTANYIVTKFGKFGTPTVKCQLLISAKARKKIYEKSDKIQLFPDTTKLSKYTAHDLFIPKSGMLEEPKMGELFSIKLLKKIVADKLIGQKLDLAATKTRGQSLERKVLDLLGYETKENALLYGAFPYIRNQLLEVKVQDSQTVDLGKFSPEREDIVIEGMDFTTFDVRYLIALTDSKTQIIEGIILSPGSKLGELFSYVSNESYKCQRAIPMAFFEKYYGKWCLIPIDNWLNVKCLSNFYFQFVFEFFNYSFTASTI